MDIRRRRNQGYFPVSNSCTEQSGALHEGGGKCERLDWGGCRFMMRQFHKPAPFSGAAVWVDFELPKWRACHL